MKWDRLFIAIGLCELAGFIGAIFTLPALIDWYPRLQKPFFNPPNWVFAPVWILLYASMGIAVYWASEKGLTQKAKVLFGIQLGLNVLWTILFFGLKNPALGFVGILLLWISIMATMLEFRKIEPKAAAILIPYLLWTTFAGILNFYVMILNP